MKKVQRNIFYKIILFIEILTLKSRVNKLRKVGFITLKREIDVLCREYVTKVSELKNIK